MPSRARWNSWRRRSSASLVAVPFAPAYTRCSWAAVRKNSTMSSIILLYSTFFSTKASNPSTVGHSRNAVGNVSDDDEHVRYLYLPLLRDSSSAAAFARLAWFSSKMGVGSGGNGMISEDEPLVV